MSKNSTITLLITEATPTSFSVYFKGLGHLDFRKEKCLFFLPESVYRSKRPVLNQMGVTHSTMIINKPDLLEGLFTFNRVIVSSSGRKPRVSITIKECSTIPEIVGCNFMCTTEVLDYSLSKNLVHFEGKLKLNTKLAGGALELLGGNNG